MAYCISNIHPGEFKFCTEPVRKSRQKPVSRQQQLTISSKKEIETLLIMGFIVQKEKVLAIDEKGNGFPLEESLNQLELKLSKADFFRINRQCIIHRFYIHHFQLLSKTKVKVFMEEGFPNAFTEISTKRLSRFRKWAVDL